MASQDPGSKKFRTKNLNSLFLADSAGSTEPKERNVPSPVPQRRTSLATARGTYRLTAMKDNGKESSWIDDKSPDPGAKSSSSSPMVAASHTASPAPAASSAALETASPAASQHDSLSPAAAPPPASQAVPASPAHKQQQQQSNSLEPSAEPFSWDEEDDNWQPPTVSSAQAVSQVSGGAGAVVAPPRTASPEPAPWTVKPAAAAPAKSLHERIAELKQGKGPGAGVGTIPGRHGGGPGSHFGSSYSHRPGVSHPPGVDGLSRFRIRGDPAELDPRQPSRFGRGYRDGYDDYGGRGGYGHGSHGGYDHGHHGRFDSYDHGPHGASHGRFERGPSRDPLDDIDSWRRPARREPMGPPPTSYRRNSHDPAPHEPAHHDSAHHDSAHHDSAPHEQPGRAEHAEQNPSEHKAAEKASAGPPAPAEPTRDSAAAPEPSPSQSAEDRKKEQEEIMRQARLRLQARKDAEEKERLEREARLQAKLDELKSKKAEEQARIQREREEKERKRLEEERKRMEEERRIRTERIEREEAEREAKRAARTKSGAAAAHATTSSTSASTATPKNPAQAAPLRSEQLADLATSWRRPANAPAGPASSFANSAKPTGPAKAKTEPLSVPEYGNGAPVTVKVPQLGRLRLNLQDLPFAKLSAPKVVREQRPDRANGTHGPRISLPKLELLQLDELAVPETPLGFSSTLFSTPLSKDVHAVSREPLPQPRKSNGNRHKPGFPRRGGRRGGFRGRSVRA